MRAKIENFWIPLGLFVFTTLLYTLTMGRHISNTDHGELLTVAISWGTAHPTGYPLFTFLGFLFSKLPLGLSPLLKLNFLNVIFCSGAVPIVFLAYQNFIRASFPEAHQKGFVIISSLAGSLITAFSITIWQQSNSYEVYSLHLFLLSLLLWNLSGVANKETEDRNWIFLAISLGLSFSNHMSTIVILPAIAFLFFSTKKLNPPTMLLLGKMLLIFFLILFLFYGLLWWRASFQPLLNWGDPSNSFNFWRHVSGAQYQVWMFESGDLAWQNLLKYFKNWPGEFAFLPWVIGMLGILILWSKNRQLFFLSLILFLANVLYVINYSIHDLEPYFLLSYLSFGIWVSVGIFWIWQKINISRAIALALVFVSICSQILYGYEKCDKSSSDLIENYSRRAINSLPPNALLISRQWDVLNSPLYYLQFVEGLRPDVEIVGKELLRRSWYYPQLKALYPVTMEKIQSETDQFLVALEPFEKNENFNAQKLSRLYQKLFEGFILSNIQGRPVYIGPEIFVGDIRGTKEWALPKNVGIFPEEYFLRLSLDGPKMQSFKENFDYVPGKEGDVYTEMIRENIAQVRTFQALFLLSMDRREEAKNLVRSIKKGNRKMVLPPILESL